MYESRFLDKDDKLQIIWLMIFQKDEICKETNYEGEIIKVCVSPEYYKAEFEDKNDKL